VVFKWVVAAACAANAIASAMTMPNGGSDAAPAGHFVDGTFTSDAGTRRWKLWVPRGYDATRRRPLVVMLHGCTQDPDDLARGTRVTEHADRRDLLVLLPEQPVSANVKKCWNWYDPAHQARDAGEPALIAGMTRQAMQSWAVDSSRVYLAGISAGAAMASLVAVAYPDVYAAVALHSGIPYRAASNVMEGVAAMSAGVPDPLRLARAARDAMGARARVIPAMIVQGAADPVVKPVNALHTRDLWVAMNALVSGKMGEPPVQVAPARRAESRVAGLDVVTECYGPRTASERTASERTASERTASECEVETLTVAGLAHAWSGGSRLGTFTDERGPDATDEILRFLLAHPMPAAGAPNAARP
jgi:poly(hydroxyalkanoate) depolymerase family esterase